MNKDKGWVVYPLEDKKVNELVLPRRHVTDLRKLSREQKELTGLLYGVPRENSLYLVGYLQLGEGTRTECGFNEDYRWFQNEFATRIKKAHPDLTTAIYHNHPLLTPEEHPREVIDILKEEIESGVFDYLMDYGIEPTIHNVIAEQSRYLSEADVKATFGRVHVLITDTERDGSSFSHINAYKFDPNSSLLGAELFKVTPLSDKSQEIHSWLGGVCSSMKKIDYEMRN